MARDYVEPLIGEEGERRRVRFEIGDPERVGRLCGTSPFEELVRDVDADHVRAAASELAREAALSAGEVEDATPAEVGQQPEQREGCRVLEVMADEAVVKIRDLVVARNDRLLDSLSELRPDTKSTDASPCAWG